MWLIHEINLKQPNKWQKIIEVVNTSGHSLFIRNGPTCKDKWGLVYGYFKRIFYYSSRIGNNTKYWELTPQKKIALNHPRHFSKLIMYE
jgi:hypothetical protein